MDSYNRDSAEQFNLYRVRDTKLLLMLMIALLPMGWLSYESTIGYIVYLTQQPNDYYLEQTDLLGGYAFEVFAGIVAVTLFLLFRLRAVWSGVKLDIDNRIIHIPGGNISANNFIDYIKPSFLLQHFLRFHIDMDRVRQIGAQTKTKTTKMDNGRINTKHRYSLELRGAFGAANVWFVDEGKRDEIYAAIRELNSMGDPFLRV
jgi:hypothetical protein